MSWLLNAEHQVAWPATLLECLSAFRQCGRVQRSTAYSNSVLTQTLDLLKPRFAYISAPTFCFLLLIQAQHLLLSVSLSSDFLPPNPETGIYRYIYIYREREELKEIYRKGHL